MGKPQVTLTFAGDSSKLESAFDKVGSSARNMDTDVGKASKSVGDSSKAGFDRAGDAADGAEGKAQGFSDTLTGTKDLMGGVGEIAKGNLFEGFVMAGQGAADLAGGMAQFLIPMGKSALLKAFAAGQWLVNAAMSANPIGLVVAALVLLVAGIVIAYKKSETFRTIVDKAMGGIKTAFGWVIDKGKALVGWFADLPGKIGGFFADIPKKGEALVGWFKDLPGKIGGFFGGVGSIISKPFTSAFQGIKDFWNNNVGGKGFSVPDWIPGIGGKSFTIPKFHSGGIMPGAPGSEGLALLQAGERITPTNQVGRESQPAGDIYVTVEIDGQQLQGRITKTVRDSNRELKRTVKAA